MLFFVTDTCTWSVSAIYNGRFGKNKKSVFDRNDKRGVNECLKPFSEQAQTSKCNFFCTFAPAKLNNKRVKRKKTIFFVSFRI